MLIEFNKKYLEKKYLCDPSQNTDMTYEALLYNADQLTVFFKKVTNFVDGEKKTVLLSLKHPSNYMPVLIACWQAGLIPAIYSPNLSVTEYEVVLKDFNFDYFFSDFELTSDFLDSKKLKGNIVLENGQLESYTLEQEDTEIALLLFSSGTSGKQKCIPLSFKNLLSNINAFTKRVSIFEDSKFLCGSPLWHAHGLYNSFLTAFFLKTTVFYSGPLNMMNASVLLKSVTTEKKIVFHITPSMIPILLMYAKKNIEKDLPYFYKMICGTSFLDANSKKKVEDLYKIKIYQQYGMTETLFMTINNEFSDEKPDSVGQVIDDVIIEICKGDELQSSGMSGLIRVKSNSFFGSYYKGVEENKSFQDGYFYTGDIGYFDEDKSLFITGREKDLIKKGGFSISANTISSKISMIEGVEDAFTIGIKDSIAGEEIYSFYICENDISENEIRIQIKNDIPDKLMPKKIFRIKSFPKTETGKIIKPEMEAILNSLLK